MGVLPMVTSTLLDALLDAFCSWGSEIHLEDKHRNGLSPLRPFLVSPRNASPDKRRLWEDTKTVARETTQR